MSLSTLEDRLQTMLDEVEREYDEISDDELAQALAIAQEIVITLEVERDTRGSAVLSSEVTR